MGVRSQARMQAIHDLSARQPRKFEPPKGEKGQALRVSEYFGMNTFDLHKMKEKLPKDTYQKLISTIKAGKKLDGDVAETVAQAVKEWALSRGVTHYCHWFQPQTGATAEKHDVFLTLDEHNRPIEKFSGSQLIQSEPDASSFPSGGMRTTFEARGYTAWDPSSPIFIMEGTNSRTLCIPSAFISYHGDALDEKTGLVRSMEVLSQRVVALLNLIGDTKAKRVVSTLGAEQEYFLIDRALYNLRPDLVMSGRTLVGGQPPKGQQLEDHYFGSISSRVLAFMSEVEFELHKLGVPVKTRHNEVAPSQYETAPVFAEANVATDHNQLTMEILRKVARRHGYEVLLHEKPYAGLNGNGKHCNWSMQIEGGDSDSECDNLLDPGKTPYENLRFLLMLTAVLRGVHKHSGMLRAGIASAGNDHRLGANEAPPAIISAFLGHELNKILDTIEKGTEYRSNPEAAVLKLGVSKLPEVAKDNTDRNRTSPFAFTGNKFEFRAVGGSASTALPVTFVNVAVADGVEEVTEALKAKLQTAKSKEEAILEVVKEFTAKSKAIRFEGNNYSPEWVKEAEARGLPHLRSTPEALDQMVISSTKEVLTRLGVFTEAELVSRYHVRTERYLKALQIELETLRSMVDTQVVPAAYAYHGELAQAVVAAKAAGVKAPQSETLGELTALLDETRAKRAALEKAVVAADGIGDESTRAKAYCNQVKPAMEGLRFCCDRLENIVSDEHWPLPKYREIFFLGN